MKIQKKPFRGAIGAILACGLLTSMITTQAAASTETRADPQHADAHPAPAVAQATNYRVRVFVESIKATNNFDGDPFFDKADFFAVVGIANFSLTSPGSSNDQNPQPNWELAANWAVADLNIDLIAVTIAIRDSDNCGTSPNCGDLADVTPQTASRSLSLLLDLSECAFGVAGAIKDAGGVGFGRCGQTIFTAGATGSGTFNTAELNYRIVVDRPTTAVGLNVRAIHNSLWPLGGDTVNIAAEALDDTELLAPKLVENIDIYIDSVLVKTCAGASICDVNKVAPPAGGSIAYKADVRNGIETISTGWRRIQVGLPPEGRAIPVLFTGPRASRIDIAFAPDSLSGFAGSSSAPFLGSLQALIRTGFYGRRWMLKNQDKFNFWIAQDSGMARGFPTNWPSRCVDGPPNQGSDYAFAEAVAIVHSTGVRSCAYPGQRIFSMPSDGASVMLHEVGHAAFGLADEYCCDSSYFQPNPFPNIYAALSSCHADAPNLVPFDRRIGVADRLQVNCRQISDGTQSINYYRSDPDDDLMLGNGRIQGADLRRMEWVLESCDSALCRASARTQSQDRLERAAAGPPLFDFGTGQKILVMNLNVGNAANMTATVSGVHVTYGHPAATIQNPNMIKVDGLTKNGSLISSSPMWNPLLAKSWSVGGELIVNHHGGDSFEPASSSQVAIPFSSDLGRVMVGMPSNSNLAEVNVRSAIVQFCQANRSDPECDTVESLPVSRVSLPLIVR